METYITTECFIKGKDGKYLMLKRSPQKRIMPNVILPPGGRVEQKEGMFEAARREVMEEVGIEIENVKLKALCSSYVEDLNMWLNVHYLVSDYKSGEINWKTPDGELVWMSVKEIEEDPNTLAALRKTIKYILDGTERVISYKVVNRSSDNSLKDLVIESSS